MSDNTIETKHPLGRCTPLPGGHVVPDQFSAVAGWRSV